MLKNLILRIVLYKRLGIRINLTPRVIYKRTRYNLDIKDFIYILVQLTGLFLIRFVRFIKRLIKYLEQLKIAFFSIIIFAIIIIPLGLQLNKYQKWYDGLWDLRMFFLTSIFIVIMTNVINSEKKRKILLVKQLDLYKELSFQSHMYLHNLYSQLGFIYNNDIFLTNKHCDKFITTIDKADYLTTINKLPIYMTNKDYFKYLSKKYYDILIKYKNFISSETILGYDENNTKKRYDRCIDIIEKQLYIIGNINDDNYEIELKNFIKRITYSIFLVISELRKPWRLDYKRDCDIRKRLLGKQFYGTNTLKKWLIEDEF